MEVQSQSSSEGMRDHDPGTPVVVKTGSNGPPGSNKVEVIIDSPYMAFTKFVPGPTEEVWVSHSTLKGRIHTLSILESAGGKADDKKQPYPQLAEIKIEYGENYSLVVREKGSTVDQDVVLEITSVGASFAETPEEWTTATDLFPPLTRVVFLGGNKVLVDREFTDTNAPTLIIKFPKPTAG